jgi:hypothetical protein
VSQNTDPIGQYRWLPFTNTAAQTIPPFGVFQCNGMQSQADGSQIILAQQSQQYGGQYQHYVNGPYPVASGANGNCLNPKEGPCVALTAGIAAAQLSGTPFGPVPNDWALHQYVGGFVATDLYQGSAQFTSDSGPQLIWVDQAPMLTVQGKTSTSVQGMPNPGTDSAFQVWFQDGTVNSGYTLPNVANYTNGALTAGTFCIAVYADSTNGDPQWAIVAPGPGGVVLVTLTDTLNYGGAAPAKDGAGVSYTVYEALGMNGNAITDPGLFHAGQRLQVTFNSLSQHWEVIQPLPQVIRAQLTQDLTQGSTATANATSGRQVQVTDVTLPQNGSIPSGTWVFAEWDADTSALEVISGQQSANIVRGTIGGLLQKGGTVTLTDPTDDSTYDVHEVLGINDGSFPSGTTLTAFYNGKTKQWEVLQPLPQVIFGTLTSLLSSGGQTPITATDNQTYTVYEWMGLGQNSINNGTKITAAYDNNAKQFKVIAAACVAPS